MNGSDDNSVPDLSQEQREFIEEGLSLSLEDRYTLLGLSIAVITPEGQQVRLSQAEANLRGKEIFNRVTDQLRAKICIEWNYCEKKKLSKYQNHWAIIAALLGLITGLLGDVGATQLLLVLIGIGIDEFCQCT